VGKTLHALNTAECLIPDIDDELLFRVATGASEASEVRLVDEWRRQSPENEQRYLGVVAILDAMTQLERGRSCAEPPRSEQVTGVGRQAVVLRKRRSFLGRPVALAIAATLVAAVGAGVWQASSSFRFRPAFGAEQFVTGPAETATIVLKDSTVVRLAPQSRLRLLEVPGVRAVVLEGRAYFAVAKNGRLPFRIQTNAGEVTVLGTRFDLEASQQDLRLVVVEGQVTLKPTGKAKVAIVAGEISQVKAGRLLPVLRVPDASAAIAWTGSFLAFQGTPVRDAVREIERQYGVHVHLADSSLADRTLTMWFANERLESMLGIVCLVLESTCSVAGSEITIKPYSGA
jgi:transmembrane sensor